VKGGSSWAESWERDGEKGSSVGVRKRELCVCERVKEWDHVLLCATAQQQAMREKERPSVGERRKFCSEETRRSRASVEAVLACKEGLFWSLGCSRVGLSVRKREPE
jgi:hypothetical protein